MKTILITQARIGSSRLPRKILKKVNGKTFLEIHLERIKKSKALDEIIVATTFEDGSDEILEIAHKLEIKSFQGSTEDVLDRYFQAAKSFNPDIVVRVTSDCPLIDAQIIDLTIKKIIEGPFDYVSNTFNPTFPHGLDVEAMTFKTLETCWEKATLKEEREHVTPYIRKNSSFFNNRIFKAYSIENEENNSNFRITLDYKEDEELLRNIIEKWGYENDWKMLIRLFKEHHQLFEKNQHLNIR